MKEEQSDGSSVPAVGPDHRDGDQPHGVPAHAEQEGRSPSPSGSHGLKHWPESAITEPGLDHRGSVFFAAVEMTRMPMILTDPNRPDNPVVFANHAFQALTGYELGEIVGRNCRFLQGAQSNAEQISELRNAITEQRAVAVELLNYKRDGTPFWNAVYVAPVYDKAGRLVYFFASQLDITRRRMSEQAFRQAQKMEAIGQLTAGLAHDFNNMLQVVAGNLELLQVRLTDERLRRCVDNAAAAADRGANLTRQLLAFARKTRLDTKPTNLNSLIVEFGDMLDSAVGGQVNMRLDLKPRLPPCLVDPAHLEMALLNVLINARDAMPRGGLVTISTGPLRINTVQGGHEEHLSPGEYVALTVTDEGEGMPPYVLERATEPFFTTKGTGKGTGLGLAMVHGFVQQSLGRLEIESHPGQGTTVRMIFPVAAISARSNPPTMLRPVAATGDSKGGTETILVAEDSEDVLALAREHLLALGYRVLTAHNGNEALSVLENEANVDLLFTDLVMPGGMNGLVLAERARERRPDLAVLLTTGYNDELVADGPRAPSMDVLGKPYRRSELADRVRAALNYRGQSSGVLPVTPNEGVRHEG